MGVPTFKELHWEGDTSRQKRARISQHACRSMSMLEHRGQIHALGGTGGGGGAGPAAGRESARNRS